MSPQTDFHDTPNFNSITQFLHHCSQTNNFVSIKKFHAHLLRTGLLFISPNLHTKLIFTNTTFLHKTNLKTLTNYLKFLTPKNPLPFNSLTSLFSQNGFPSLALHTFSFMHFNGVVIDSYTLCSSLTAASSCGKNVLFGKQVHAHVGKSGWLSSVFVASALIDFYAKSLVINDAAMLFDEIPVRNTVCVNAVLWGYSEAKMWVEGIELVRRMPCINLNYDNFTFSAALKACAGLSAVELGRQVHGSVIRTIHDVGSDMFLQSLLIEMYGKCGLVEKARKVFNMMEFGEGERKRDVVLWTSMLGVYGRNGNYREVIGLFNEMLIERIRPDGVAFVTVISACGHTGQVSLGMEYFKCMTRDFGLCPSPEHYSCVVDLLCRAGELDKAWKLMNEIQNTENVCCTISMWGALLSACNDCGNVDIGKLAANRALELDPQNDGIYVLLSNMYARFGMWNEIEQLRELMKERELKKHVGCSWIEVER